MTRPKDRNAEVDFRGEKRSNATPVSVTDPEARLHRKSPGAGALLCFMGHVLMENRNGLVVRADLTQADGRAERRAAIDMIDRHSPDSPRRLTLGADQGFDSADFVAEPAFTGPISVNIRAYLSRVRKRTHGSRKLGTGGTRSADTISGRLTQLGLVDDPLLRRATTHVPQSASAKFGELCDRQALIEIDRGVRSCRCLLGKHNYPWDREPIRVTKKMIAGHMKAMFPSKNIIPCHELKIHLIECSFVVISALNDMPRKSWRTTVAPNS